jgi:hypothetical protein
VLARLGWLLLAGDLNGLLGIRELFSVCVSRCNLLLPRSSPTYPGPERVAFDLELRILVMMAASCVMMKFDSIEQLLLFLYLLLLLLLLPRRDKLSALANADASQPRASSTAGEGAPHCDVHDLFEPLTIHPLHLSFSIP